MGGAWESKLGDVKGTKQAGLRTARQQVKSFQRGAGAGQGKAFSDLKSFRGGLSAAALVARQHRSAVEGWLSRGGAENAGCSRASTNIDDFRLKMQAWHFPI
jgi:hypothetical protein